MWKEIGHATGRKDVSVHELDTIIIFAAQLYFTHF